MKRLPLLGLILALASCTPTIGDVGDQALACYDTGSGMKCVPLDELPANTSAVCLDKDGETQPSQSSASGPSLSDNDVSASSDSPTLVGAVLPTDEDGDGDDDDGEDGETGDASDSSTEDASGASDSTEETCATATDTDKDGVSDSKDCDCLDVDTPTGTPPGDNGPIIL